MKAYVSSFAALASLAIALAAQERADVKPKDQKETPPPSQAVYQHTTAAGRVGKFELNGKQGKADYYFNGQHHQDDLVYVRVARMRDPSLPGAVPGWVYQVSRKGKKESLWFYFAANPLAQGGDRYAMFYSTTPPGSGGKQPWERILTPGGTKRTPLEGKAKDGAAEK